MLRVQDLMLPAAARASLPGVRLSVFCPCSSLVRASRAASPRVRAGLVRDVEGAGPRTNWLLGRLRLFRARRAVT